MALVLHFRRKVTQIMQNESPRFDFLREKISTTALQRFFRDGDALRRWRRSFLEMAAVGGGHALRHPHTNPVARVDDDLRR